MWASGGRGRHIVRVAVGEVDPWRMEVEGPKGGGGGGRGLMARRGSDCLLSHALTCRAVCFGTS